MRKQNSLRPLIGGAAVCALAAGTFAWGMHLGPEGHAGRDLFRAQTPRGAQAASLPTGRNVVLAAASGPRLLAASDAPGLPPSGTDAEDDVNGDSPAATFQQIYMLLKRNYVEGVPDDSKLSHGAAAAMVASLQDPNSRFFEPTEFAEVQREAKGQFAGIGAVLAVRTKITPKAADDPTRDKDHPDNISYELTVVSPLPGGPADKASLQTGDVITDIDGQWIATYDLVSAEAKQLKAVQDKNDPVALNKLIDTLQKKLDNGLTLAQAETKLTTADAKPLALMVSRPGQAAPLAVNLTPVAATTVAPVAGKTLAGGIGYIKINRLGSDTEAAFRSALASLGPDVKGLVLDLRDATGDSTDAATAVAAKLSTVNTLGYQLTKGNAVTAIPVTPARAVAGPVVVLVNGGTADVAEVLASALRDGGAKLIGTPTFGDDVDVKPISLRDGSGFTMTVGKYETASKTDFGGVGIKPDVAVPDVPGSDGPLNRAVMELSGRVAQVP